jgi:5-formyltetrahydrofolate cyclo-ligase
MLEKKKILRKIIKVRVSAISADEKAKREKLLLDNLFSMPEFLAANTVMLFANLPDEIGTFSLIDKCIAMGKKVFLPVINGDDMTACEFKGEYKIGKYDIKEPVINKLGIRNEELGINGLITESRDNACIVRDSDTELVDVRDSVPELVEGPEHFDFVLVPGVAFSPNGYRLGRGKGYYDKFLSKYSNLFTVGVCFREQFFLDIPTEPHDIPMQKVIVC